MLTQSKTQTSIEVSRPALVKLLERARHVVPCRSPKPVLSCVRLEVREGFLQVCATDGELNLFAQMPAEGTLQPCVVPFDELWRRLKASKQPMCGLALSDNGDRLLLNGGRVEHALHTLDLAEFPVVPAELQGDSIEVNAAEFVRGLKVASRAVAKEPSRYAIDGILLESNEKGSRLVATDGRRLVMVELRDADELGNQSVLPHRFCRLIDKLTARDTNFLALAVDREKSENGNTRPRRVFAAGPDWVLSTYECDGRFPMYRDVIPRKHSRFAIDREALMETLAEVALACDEANRVVRLDLGSEELVLFADAPGMDKSEASVAADFLGGGDSCIRTAFNPDFLVDALKTLNSDLAVIDIDQNGCGCDGKVTGKPALIYDRYNAVVCWVLMPVNAGLEATPENLGSNHPEELEDEANDAA